MHPIGIRMLLKAARNKLLTPECREVFNNPLLIEWGLNDGIENDNVTITNV